MKLWIANWLFPIFWYISPILLIIILFKIESTQLHRSIPYWYNLFQRLFRLYLKTKPLDRRLGHLWSHFVVCTHLRCCLKSLRSKDGCFLKRFCTPQGLCNKKSRPEKSLCFQSGNCHLRCIGLVTQDLDPIFLSYFNFFQTRCD